MEEGILSIRPKQKIFLFFALLVALDSFPVMAQSGRAPSANRSRVYEYAATETARASYVAVVGEVTNPGTYHVDESELNLHDVILKRAGGLTREASRNIRVVRDGKVNHQERFSESRNSQVRSGDVLIVDSEAATSRASKIREFGTSDTTVPAIYEPPEQNDGIQLALINVLDYPVVVTVSPDRAHLSEIVERLNQPQDVCLSANVLSAQGVARGGQAIQLVSGSAVIFPRGAIQKNRLPANLPKPIESQIAVGAYSNLTGQTDQQFDEFQNLGQQPINSSNDYNSPGASAAVPSIRSEVLAPLPPELPPSFGETRDEGTDVSTSQRARIANAPFSGNAQFRNSSLGSPIAEIVEEPPQARPERARVSMKDLPVPAPAAPIEELEEIPTSSSSWVTWAIATILIGGLTIACALVFRKNLIPKRQAVYRVDPPQAVPFVARREIVESAQKSAPLVKKTLLELMIKNEIPTAVESVRFPADLELQGRIAPKLMIRVDGPEDIVNEHGPHLKTPDHLVTGYSLQEVVAQVDQSEAEPIRRPHFIDRSRQTAQQTEVAAAAAPVKQTVTEQSSAPLAKALFDLEQGGRS